MEYKFIVFEGIDGSGTTIQTNLVSDYFFMDGLKKILITQEPTIYSPFGKEIRKILKGGCNDKERLLDLFINDRKWHNENILKPFLDDDYTIFCDRYVLSTYVYQGLQGFDI